MRTTRGDTLPPRDWLRIARLLAVTDDGGDHAALGRAVSATYYAAFHHLAHSAADLLIGARGPDASDPAWRQVYRALEHGAVWNACRHREVVGRFPRAIQDYAQLFVEMQDDRVSADYDPDARFDSSQVRADIDAVTRAIQGFDSESERDRRAFCAYILLKQPRLRPTVKTGPRIAPA